MRVLATHGRLVETLSSSTCATQRFHAPAGARQRRPPDAPGGRGSEARARSAVRRPSSSVVMMPMVRPERAISGVLCPQRRPATSLCQRSHSSASRAIVRGEVHEGAAARAQRHAPRSVVVDVDVGQLVDELAVDAPPREHTQDVPVLVEELHHAGVGVRDEDRCIDDRRRTGPPCRRRRRRVSPTGARRSVTARSSARSRLVRSRSVMSTNVSTTPAIRSSCVR